jgi:S1-C subfamily serine protease
VQPVGIGLDQQGKAMFARQILARSLAEEAGLKGGNLIVSLNAEKPSSVADEMEKMMAIGFGSAMRV